MLLILPPSETKRDGGDASRALELDSLRYPQLMAVRVDVARRLRELAANEAAMMAALKLGPRQRGEVERNRSIAFAATLPAVDRYAGVLYDALEAPALSPAARAFADEHLVVHSALFGPIAALDRIPAYRLSASSRLPGRPLAATWAAPVAAALVAESGLVIDLRSEGYVKLGAAPTRDDVVYVRVVSSLDGRGRALNHFNKRTKGLFARAVLEHGVEFTQVAQLIDWARGEGFEVQRGAGSELELVAPALEPLPG